MLGNLVYVLHVLGAVLWVGGVAFAIFCLAPAQGVLDPPQRLALHAAVLTRFFRLVWAAMPVLLVSGWVLLFGWYGGFARAGWHIHAMHFAALTMAAVFLALVGGPWRAFRAALARGDQPAAAAEARRMRQLVTMNLGLGLATVAVAAWGRFGG